ncbi:MAG: helix-hairpin-helix domain-containing protein, partial [Clostridiales bacterium]
KRTGAQLPFVMPTSCPECGSAAVRGEGEAVRRCQNPACPAKLREALLHFAAKKAMNIDGLGPAVIQLLLKQGLVQELPDLYRLRKEQLAILPGLGEKSADNLLAELTKSKTLPLSRLLFALGIRYVGERAGAVLGSAFDDFDALMAADQADLTEIPEIGPKIAASLTAYFANQDYRRQIEQLRQLGLNFAGAAVPAAAGILTGKTFVLSGSLADFSRDEAKALIEAAGGKVSGTVSKKTDYLLRGENPGSKAEKAIELAIEIIDQEQFLALLGGNDYA